MRGTTNKSKGYVSPKLVVLATVFLLSIPSSGWVATEPVPTTFGAGHIVGFHLLADQNAVAQDAAAAGVKWTREDLAWYLMQATAGTTPDKIDPTQQDYFVDNAVANGLNILGVLAYTPLFYSSNPGAPAYYAYPPTSAEGLAAWSNFVSTTVNHFKDRIHHWQVWSNCDDRPFWAIEPGSPDNGAAKYTELLQRAYTEIKAEDPTAVVVTCSAASEFLDAILDAGALPYFDAIGMYNYSEPYAPEVSTLLALRLSSVVDLRNRRAAGKSMWVPEYGWPTTSHSTGVDETTQAAYNIRSFLLQSSTRELDKILQMDYQDQAVGGEYTFDDPLDNYGMLVKYGTDFPNLHKSCYDAFKAMTTALDGAIPRRPSILPPDSVEVLENFETAGDGWLVATADAAGTYTRTSADSYSGSWSGRVDYTLTAATHSAVVIYPHPISAPGPLPGTPTRVSVWARGNGGPAPKLTVSFVDSTGENFSAELGLVVGTEWAKYSYYLDAPEPTSSLLVGGTGGSSPDGIIDYPIEFQNVGIRFWEEASPVTSGIVWVDDITFEYGKTVFDYVYVSSTATVHAVWAFSGATSVDIPTSATSATTLDWLNSPDVVAASGGVVTVTATQHPLFVSLPPPDDDTTGVFRPSNGQIYLKSTNDTGFADADIVFGSPGDLPVTGDWDGDGVDTIGIYRNGVFYLRNSNTTGFSDITFAFGANGDLPIAGDWDGDGDDTVGLYRDGLFMLRNSNSAGPPDMTFALGVAGDEPIAGDWDGDGVDSTGVFRPTNGLIYLKNENTTGFADVAIVFGIPNDKPAAGDWNSDGIDTIGVYRDGLFLLRNTNTTGFADAQFALGQIGDLPICGKWGALP